MDKIQQLEKQLAEISAELQKLKDVPSKPKFEVGKWYKFDSDFLPAIVCYQGGRSGYGFSGSKWKYHDNWTFDVNALDWIPATESEVFEALKKEAIKRGFKEGVKIDYSVLKGYKCNPVIIDSGIGWRFAGGELRFNGWPLFSDGKWVEIIKEEPLKIAGYEVKITDGGFDIGCKFFHIKELREIRDVMTYNKFKIVQFDEYKVTLEEINKLLEL